MRSRASGSRAISPRRKVTSPSGFSRGSGGSRSGALAAGGAVFVAGPDLAAPRQVTNTNPFLGEYAWSRTELVEYRNETGRRLQGVLAQVRAGGEPVSAIDLRFRDQVVLKTVAK